MIKTVIGITGGIGSGKSCVSRLLSSYCLSPLIDVDQCCRTLLDVQQPGWCALQKQFGSTFFTSSGEVDRPLLRRKIFQDACLREQIDALLHPLARHALENVVAEQQNSLIFVEVPLLFEAGWQGDMDKIVVVYARPGIQCCRVIARDGGNRVQASRAMRAQMNLKLKANCADYIINNSGTWELTRKQTISLGNQLYERFCAKNIEKVLDS